MLHQSCSCVIISLLDLMCYELFQVRSVYTQKKTKKKKAHIILSWRFYGAIFLKMFVKWCLISLLWRPPPPWVNTVFQFVRFSVEVAFVFVSLFCSTFDMTSQSDCCRVFSSTLLPEIREKSQLKQLFWRFLTVLPGLINEEQHVFLSVTLVQERSY